MNKTIIHNSLPDSAEINKNILLQLFNNTTNSYKYLFFMAIMKLVYKGHFQQYKFPMIEIISNMLLFAYYPHRYFKLSFGLQDKICDLLDQIQFDKEHQVIGYNQQIFSAREERLIEILYSERIEITEIVRYVPYRLIYPFFSKLLRGKPDYCKNKYIETLAIERFNDIRPLYYIDNNTDTIVLHPAWLEYIQENYELIWSYVKWEWLSYMQKKNPSIPNIQAKLFPETKRPNLEHQKNFWRTVSQHQKIHCIYSMEEITSRNINLDHFLPWTFVAHNQLWNLVPTLKSVNSSKSNSLPSLDRYFDSFVEIQHRSLCTFKEIVDSSTWQKTIEPYQVDLRINQKEIVDIYQFRKKMEATVFPLVSLASNIGFPSNWEYNG